MTEVMDLSLTADIDAREECYLAKGEQQEAYRAYFADGPEGLLEWMRLACWTFDPGGPGRVVAPADRMQPFAPWPQQEIAARELYKGVTEGHDVLFDKSREQGATWLCLAVFLWSWLFVPQTPLLVVSRKAEQVDAAGDPDTLFWKLDYLIDNLPAWMRPNVDRRHMHMGNLDNGSVIDGESTNGDVGRGGRRAAILLDEFAAVENGPEILSSTGGNTACRIFNSTPRGRANSFADRRFSPGMHVVTLHWSQHPFHGAGKHLVEDTNGKSHWTSPWYEAECARRGSIKEIAQELDIDYLASGGMFFDHDILQRIRASGDLRPPMYQGGLYFKVQTDAEGVRYHIEGVRFEESSQGKLQWWGAMVNGRPLQDRNYAAFADISHGSGASNSVIKIADVQTREEVGSLADADLPPGDFARYCVAACQWIGGQRPVVLGWETNGFPEFGIEIHKLGYAHVLGNIDTTRLWTKEDAGEIGWHSTKEEKRALLGALRIALARGELVLHDEATVAELEQYVEYSGGGVGPAALVEESGGAREAHGDRVIGTAGLPLVMGEQSRAKPVVPAAPVGSWDWHMTRKAERDSEREGSTW